MADDLGGAARAGGGGRRLRASSPRMLGVAAAWQLLRGGGSRRRPTRSGTNASATPCGRRRLAEKIDLFVEVNFWAAGRHDLDDHGTSWSHDHGPRGCLVARALGTSNNFCATPALVPMPTNAEVKALEGVLVSKVSKAAPVARAPPPTDVQLLSYRPRCDLIHHDPMPCLMPCKATTQSQTSTHVCA